MTMDGHLLTEMETTKGPDTNEGKQKLQQEMDFSYRERIGELIYALVTCWPAISFATIKLSQYSHNQARCHYIALKNVFRYLRCTIDDRLIYCRRGKHSELLDLLMPTPLTPTHEWHNNFDNNIHTPNLYGIVDSDWASD